MSSASPQEIGANDPDPFAPVRRSGCISRSGVMHALRSGRPWLLRAAHAANAIVAEHLDLERAGRRAIVRTGRGADPRALRKRADGLVHGSRTLQRLGAGRYPPSSCLFHALTLACANSRASEDPAGLTP